MDYKRYLKLLHPYIVFSFFLFIFSIFLGYFFFPSFFDEKEVIEYFQQSHSIILNANQIEKFFLVFIGNTVTLFLSVFLGLGFSLFPILVLIINGGIFGFLMHLSNEIFGLGIFFAAILPHGVIEIPVIIIGGAIGIKLGRVVIDKIFKEDVKINEEIFLAFLFFSRVLFPLIFLSALIEIFFTAKILGIY